MTLLPNDPHDAELLRQTHPPDWSNPTPTGRYNLVAIGGGTAGIIAALATAGLGGKAALIERHLLGGDCLNTGCVPSKALIRSARAIYQAQHANLLGVQGTENATLDFEATMRRMRQLRAKISHHDSAQRFRDLGVDIYLGDARFTSHDSLEVEGQTLSFARSVIATGARAAIPPIPGLEEVGYLTNETLFSLSKLPRRLVVLGAGPIGCEMAQTFRRFGSEVVLIDRAERILAREDPAAAEVLQQQMQAEGISLHLQTSVVSLSLNEEGQTGKASQLEETTSANNREKQLLLERAGEKQTLQADAILVATGRRANIEGLNLEKAGVAYSSEGVQVNDRLQTTNRKIYAAGDIAGSYQFTHAADAMARIAIENALFGGRKRLSRLVVPHATYTDPEVAHVGLTPEEAARQGIAIDSYREEMTEVDRSILDGQTTGFAVVHCRRKSGEVVGATIVGSHAGEIIGELTTLMTHRLPLGKLASVIHPYPTQAEVLKRIADAYRRTRLSPTLAKWLRRWLAWRR